MIFSDVKDEVLKVSYNLLRESDGQEYFRPAELQTILRGRANVAFVSRACQSLSEDELMLHSYSNEEDYYGLTDGGIEAAEEMLGFAVQELPNDPTIPASDRIVQLNHNSSAYEEIGAALDEVVERVRAWETNEISSDEKKSLEIEVEAARTLWDAYSLSVLKLRVGIIMTIERVETLTNSVFHLVTGPLLVDAIKAIINSALGSR